MPIAQVYLACHKSFWYCAVINSLDHAAAQAVQHEEMEMREMSMSLEQLKVTLSNQGGELDSVVVQRDTEKEGSPVKDALFAMLDGIDLEPGDTITITEAK